jgi:hypothetical protein
MERVGGEKGFTNRVTGILCCIKSILKIALGKGPLSGVNLISRIKLHDFHFEMNSLSVSFCLLVSFFGTVTARGVQKRN